MTFLGVLIIRNTYYHIIKPVFFSIGFILKDGRYVYLNKSYSKGLRVNLKDRRLKAFQPVDSKGQSIGHIYPVSIWAIVEFNGKTVCL